MKWPWTKNEPSRPEFCPEEYVCLTAEQAYDECFVGGAAPSAHGVNIGLGFIAATLLWAFAIWAVGRLRRSL